MGLSNISGLNLSWFIYLYFYFHFFLSVSRLSLTWEKLPNKFKKMFSDFESAMDPSRNHRKYRVFVEGLSPPIIPFMPLLLKGSFFIILVDFYVNKFSYNLDMTFTHEGNKTFNNQLLNFEKMVLFFCFKSKNY